MARTFTKFQRHTNNSKEKIDANDVNKIQNSVNNTESNVIEIRKNEFNSKVLYQFDNNFYVNSLFIDLYKNYSNIDNTLSSNIKLNPNDMSITIADNKTEAIIYSTLITSTLIANTKCINDIILMTDINIPAGCKVIYSIITDTNEEYPITPNDDASMIRFDDYVKGYRIKLHLYKNNKNETPTVYGISSAYYDYIVESQYGITNPDISRLDFSTQGVTILIRDKGQDDKLVEVDEPECKTYLHYNADGKLIKVLTESNDVYSEDTLNYGPYTNKDGETEEVLLSINNKTGDA